MHKQQQCSQQVLHLQGHEEQPGKVSSSTSWRWLCLCRLSWLAPLARECSHVPAFKPDISLKHVQPQLAYCGCLVCRISCQKKSSAHLEPRLAPLARAQREEVGHDMEDLYAQVAAPQHALQGAQVQQGHIVQRPAGAAHLISGTANAATLH